MKTLTVKLNIGDVVIETNSKGGGVITSSAIENEKTSNGKNSEYNAFLDGLESVLLAMACNGVDVESSSVTLAFNTALDAGCDHFAE